MQAFAEYERYDATGLAELVARGEVHPAELVEAATQRIDERNPELNAVVYSAVDRAHEEAAGEPGDGPFAGVPFLVKDLGAAVEGLPYTQSSRSRQGHAATADNELVRRYRDAGLIILGKTNTPEFGLSPATEPELHGPTRNPWDPTRTPSGSSGGSAAAVAAGMVPMAHANDGGGSIRTPASATGLFGLKPTRGRSTWGPEYVESWLGLSEQHAITRSVRDSARLLDATHGGEPGAAPVRPFDRPLADEVGEHPGPLRIAYSTGPILDTRPHHPDCVTAVEVAAALCTGLGHEVVEAAVPVDVGEVLWAFVTLAAAHAEFEIAESQRITGIDVGPSDVELITWFIHLIGKKRTAGEVERALQIVRKAGRTVERFFIDHDVILTSTLAEPPWPIGDLALSRKDRVTLNTVRRAPARKVLDMVERQLAAEILKPIPNTPLFNMTGHPAMSVPLHWNGDGLPIGVQFAGRYADEATLIRLASQLEVAKPWFDRRASMTGASTD